ncbi:PulJ/GspJ family protein [Desulfocurvibacter africanus]|uniref:PulJ/GspJ family protein n=2 Tax=Desulfocurvibacter africanus TaxID=873 RepID=UPI0004863690|nr:prepilin-type N-terminal cleavage/methylation domain-containing protein [Desulfocurvibacter africanus]
MRCGFSKNAGGPGGMISPGRRRHIAQAGFTLLEVMIAAFVMAIAFTGLYGVYAGVMDVAEQVRGQGELLQTGRLVLRQIGDDLAGLHPPAEETQSQSQATQADQSQVVPLLAGGDREEELPDVSRNPDLARSFRRGRIVLELTTCSSLDFEDAARGDKLVRVQYVLRPLEDTGMFDKGKPMRLVRKERLDPDIYPEDSVGDGWTEVELCDRVKELTIGFRARGGQKLDSWGTGGLGQPVTAKALPASAGVRLVLADEEGRREFTDWLSLDPELLQEDTQLEQEDSQQGEETP